MASRYKRRPLALQDLGQNDLFNQSPPVASPRPDFSTAATIHAYSSFAVKAPGDAVFSFSFVLVCSQQLHGIRVWRSSISPSL